MPPFLCCFALLTGLQRLTDVDLSETGKHHAVLQNLHLTHAADGAQGIDDALHQKLLGSFPVG